MTLSTRRDTVRQIKLLSWKYVYITRCYSDGEYCHVLVIAAGDIIKYQGGHMMRIADARTVRSRQETFNSNGGHDA